MRPRRRLAILAVALAAGLSLLVGLVAVIGGVGSALAGTESESSLVREPARRIVIEVGSGDVTVLATSAREPIRIARRSRSFLVRPEITQDVRDGTLTLRSDCPLPLPGPCQTTYRVKAPPGVAVTASSTAGNVRVEGFRGRVDAESTAGNVDISRGRSRVVEGSSTAGNVAVALLVAPDRVKATSTAGNVDVLLPRGAYAIEASTSAGEDSISGLVDDPGARRRITARTTAGNAAVRGR